MVFGQAVEDQVAGAVALPGGKCVIGAGVEVVDDFVGGDGVVDGGAQLAEDADADGNIFTSRCAYGLTEEEVNAYVGVGYEDGGAGMGDDGLDVGALDLFIAKMGRDGGRWGHGYCGLKL